MLTSHGLTSCFEFNISPDGTLTLKGLFITSGTFLIFLMNTSKANECVAPESISTRARILKIDSSLAISEGFLSAFVLVSVNTHAILVEVIFPSTFKTCSGIGLTFSKVSSTALIASWLL